MKKKQTKFYSNKSYLLINCINKHGWYIASRNDRNLKWKRKWMFNTYFRQKPDFRCLLSFPPFSLMRWGSSSIAFIYSYTNPSLSLSLRSVPSCEAQFWLQNKPKRPTHGAGIISLFPHLFNPMLCAIWSLDCARRLWWSQPRFALQKS